MLESIQIQRAIYPEFHSDALLQIRPNELMSIKIYEKETKL